MLPLLCLLPPPAHTVRLLLAEMVDDRLCALCLQPSSTLPKTCPLFLNLLCLAASTTCKACLQLWATAAPLALWAAKRKRRAAALTSGCSM